VKRKTAPKQKWRAKRVHPSIVRIDCEVTAAKPQWFLLRGDAHHDNPHSDHDKEYEDLREAERRGACVIDVGDLFCAMGGRADPRRSRHGVTRKEHLDAPDYFDSLVRVAAKDYAPFAHLFAIIGKGNHETSILKNQEVDLTTRLVERLNTATGSSIIEGGYGGDVHIKIHYSGSSTQLWMTYFHGSGGGGMMSFDTLRVRRQSSWNPMASVVVCGHVHERWALEIVRKVPSAEKGCYRCDLDSQWHIRTGTYKDEYGGDSATESRPSGAHGFHVERGAPPKPIGAMWMRLTIQRRGNTLAPRLEFIAT
jgi:hypothetical protein